MGATKKIHRDSLFLYLIVTQHMLNCAMQKSLYAHNITFLFCSHLILQLWLLQNKCLNILIGTMLLLLPVTIL